MQLSLKSWIAIAMGQQMLQQYKQDNRTRLTEVVQNARDILEVCPSRGTFKPVCQLMLRSYGGTYSSEDNRLKLVLMLYVRCLYC